MNNDIFSIAEAGLTLRLMFDNKDYTKTAYNNMNKNHINRHKILHK